MEDCLNRKVVAERVDSISPLLLCLSLIVCIIGIFILSGLDWIINIFFYFSYVTFFIILFSNSNHHNDWLNPLTIVLAIGFVRFCLPGLLLLFGASPDFGIFHAMGLNNDDWLFGHILALVGLFGIVVGWNFPTRLPGVILQRLSSQLRFPVSDGVRHATILGMILGFIALFLFIRGNTSSVVDVAVSGEFRSLEIEEGTGKYRYLSYFLIVSSVIFSSYLTKKNFSWYVALLPVIFSAMSFAVLGGRSRAFSPFAAGLLLLWYRKINRKVTLKVILCWSISVVLFLVFLNVGSLYRAGLGLEALKKISMAQLVSYIQYSVWVEIGHLQSLAGAIAIGPGVLGGQSFFALLWPFSLVFGLGSKNSGRFIIQTLTGREFGFHPSLIGDAYLNYGLLGVILITILFGILLRSFYKEFRKGSIDQAFFVLAIVYGMRIFYSAIQKYIETFIIITLAIFVVKTGKVLLHMIHAR